MNYDAKVLSNYKEDSGDENSESFSVEYDVSTRLSKYIKGKTFRYVVDRKNSI